MASGSSVAQHAYSRQELRQGACRHSGTGPRVQLASCRVTLSQQTLQMGLSQCPFLPLWGLVGYHSPVRPSLAKQKPALGLMEWR